jgi:hypothetical protein
MKAADMADSLNEGLKGIGYPINTLALDMWLQGYGAINDIEGFERYIWLSQTKDWLHEDGSEEHDVYLAQTLLRGEGNVLIGVFTTGMGSERAYLVGWQKVSVGNRQLYKYLFQIGWKEGRLLPGSDYPRKYLGIAAEQIPLSQLVEEWTFTETEYSNNYGEIMIYSIDTNDPMFSQSMNWSELPFLIMSKFK